MSKATENEYIKLIAEVDKLLTTLRDLRDKTKDKDELKKWKERIDQTLDERLRLMALRDGKKSS